ncbi:MAG: hypothetical protein HN337_05730 [Deltaproteobacteria bacterium]|nr:hypothetical protein [Deltaproteobacteria bacterium]
MLSRILKILLVSSEYDLYIMEEEGLISDRISDDYALLHLTNAPIVTRVSTAKEAIKLIQKKHFDLVVTGIRVGKKTNIYKMAMRIKELSPSLPIAILTSETGRLSSISKMKCPSNVDKVFFWHGDARLFLAIIKYFEDILNAPHDCLEENARVIILVEDSPQFYSTYLPLIYTEILEQTRSLIAEGASDEEKVLRMTSRPKILLAETYEEAVTLYKKYHDNVLGIISDRRFPKAGEPDIEAGFAFTKLVKKDNPNIPVLLQSKDSIQAYRAASLGASFADKNSPHLLQELRKFILNHFGFGDFIFYLPNGKEVGRARNRREMERVLDSVPDESIVFHGKKNHFSHWLFARGEFGLAAELRPMKYSDFKSTDDIRNKIKGGLELARKKRRKARISQFSERDFELTTPFIRFGGGSIGGKGRGIAFMSKLLMRPDIEERLSKYNIYVPQTAALGTEVFDRFLEKNHLYKIAMEEKTDSVIASAFLEAELGTKLVGELAAFLKKITQPLAIRSSSLSEDSLSQPFAGLYATYLIPNNQTNFEERLRQFLSAIKLVYASTFFSNPKAYMEANGIAVESEKMAVIIQQVAGHAHGHYFYPDIAGVAQSYNFFPVGYLKPEDGVSQLVMGLGTTAMRGEKALRFSPKYPNILPQYSKTKDILMNSQRMFDAIDLHRADRALSTNEHGTLASLELKRAEKNGPLPRLGAVYSPEDDVIYEGTLRDGQRILTFKRILSGSEYPIPKIIESVLEIGSSGMGCPVEVEYAANLSKDGSPASFAFLQIRPLVTGEEAEEVCIDRTDDKRCLLLSNKAMGNGLFDNIKHLIFVKREDFDIKKTSEIAAEIGKLNTTMISKGLNYILIGFGRWGTANPLLGIPVSYSQISHAKVICEISTEELNVEPSQGTHFFHNIASCRIGYISIDMTDKQNKLDWEWLNSQKVVKELDYVKMIKLRKPLITKIDGRSGSGVILKPKAI